jgi:hypothetical protein
MDRDFGPFFIKFCSYFPFNGRCCINGNEWAKRQAAHAGIDFEPLDNGFSSCEDPARLNRICASLSAHKIDALVRKWLRILPHPFTGADRRAGYRYDVSILQAEFSLTQTLDRPLSGRVFFEEVIRDNLDLGRPDQVALIFSRRVNRRTPGRFRTRVLTEGVVPSLHVDYKRTKVKQYHKLGQALRTETTINDARDFGVGKRLYNLPALREIGFSANRRLLEVERTSCDCQIGEEAFAQVCAPGIVNGQRAPGTALRRPPCPGALERPCRLPSLARRVLQPRPPRAPRAPAGPPPGIHDRGQDDLRPPALASPRPHRTRPAHPPLPRHPLRATDRDVLYPDLRAPAPPGPRPHHGPERPSHPTASPVRSPRHSHRPAHRQVRSCCLKLDSVVPAPPARAS